VTEVRRGRPGRIDAFKMECGVTRSAEPIGCARPEVCLVGVLRGEIDDLTELADRGPLHD
jgi:hypothetical protein